MKAKIYPVNLKQVVSKVDLIAARLPSTSNRTTKGLADQILEDSDSIPPMVPTDTTALQSTGRVEQVRGEGGRFGSGFAVVYGGQSPTTGIFVDYANQVHDDLRDRNYQRPGSGPKFVEAHYLQRTEQATDDYLDDILALCADLL